MIVEQLWVQNEKLQIMVATAVIAFFQTRKYVLSIFIRFTVCINDMLVAISGKFDPSYIYSLTWHTPEFSWEQMWKIKFEFKWCRCATVHYIISPWINYKSILEQVSTEVIPNFKPSSKQPVANPLTTCENVNISGI